MHRSQRGETRKRKPGCRVRGVHVRGLLVWTLLGMGLLVGSMPNAAQAVGQQEMRSAQGPEPQQPPAGQAPARPSQPGQATVTVDGSKLSVSLREAGVREVLEAIARQAGMKVSFLGAVGQATLTASFVGLPVEAGLRRLLQGMDYAFVYTGTGAARRVGQIFVMAGAAEQPQAFPDATVDAPTVAVAKAIREAVDTQRFGDALQAAIAAEGGTTQEEDVRPAVALNTAFQQVFSGQAGAQQVQDQLRRVTDRLQQQLEQQGP